MPDSSNALYDHWQMFQILHDLGVAFLDNHGERIDIEARLSEARAAEEAQREERLKSLQGDISTPPKRAEATGKQIDAVFDAWTRGRVGIAGESQEQPVADKSAEKMIPISAINGLMNCIAGELGGGDGNVNVRLLPFYDLAARHTGHSTAMDLLRRRARLN